MDVSINSTGFLLQQQKHHLGFIWMTTGGSEEFKKNNKQPSSYRNERSTIFLSHVTCAPQYII